MALTGTVSIGRETWQVSVARTPSELVSGLSNVPSIPTYTGILFDIGGSAEHYSSCNINLSSMLFPIDIISIAEGYTDTTPTRTVFRIVAKVDQNCVTADPTHQVSNVRYFMEVNSGEASDLHIGDEVIFNPDMNNTLLTVPVQPIDVSMMMNFVITMMIVVMMMKMMTGMFSSSNALQAGK